MISEQKAVSMGMRSTGVYESLYATNDQGWAKTFAQKLRKCGYKVQLVKRHDGITVYAEQRYFYDEHRAELEARLEHISDRKTAAYEKYLAEIDAIDADARKWEEQLSALKQKMANG